MADSGVLGFHFRAQFSNLKGERLSGFYSSTHRLDFDRGQL